MQEEIVSELERIREYGDGILRPEEIVKVAKNPKNILHGHFEWDDTAAAEQHRLWQARMLIRVAVTVLPRSPGNPVRMYVSLKDDRAEDGGGYRALVDVLSDTEMRERLLAEALEDFTLFERKYDALKELAPLFRVVKRIRARASAQVAAVVAG